MYSVRAAFLSAVSAMLAVAVQAANLAVSIDSIAKDDHISGKVTGITEAARETHKIVVYVKTDRWYIHPFSGDDEGTSWASIAGDGSWTIGTKFRGHKASSIAVLVVAKDAEVPSEADNVQDIPNQAILVKPLKGTPDFGKL